MRATDRVQYEETAEYSQNRVGQNQMRKANRILEKEGKRNIN